MPRYPQIKTARIPLEELVDRKRTNMFWSKAAQSTRDACWLWEGQRETTKGGTREAYGVFEFGPHPTDPARQGHRRFRAHRVAFELEYGPRTTEGWCVLHHCDTPLCVNPNHLFLGSHKDNADDRTKKGRGVHRSKLGRRKLTAEEVVAIRQIAKDNPHLNYERIGRMFNVTAGNVSAIVRRKTWRDVL